MQLQKTQTFAVKKKTPQNYLCFIPKYVKSEVICNLN